MELPYIQSNDLTLSLLQTRYRSVLNPLLALPISNASFLTDIDLINGTTIVNHKLGRKMQGWVVTDVNAAATIYRAMPLNDKTLTLVSNAACTVSLMVY